MSDMDAVEVVCAVLVLFYLLIPCLSKFNCRKGKKYD